MAFRNGLLAKVTTVRLANVTTVRLTKVTFVRGAKVQWNLIIPTTCGPNIPSSNIEVAALLRCKCVESHHMELELGGCNNEVAA